MSARQAARRPLGADPSAVSESGGRPAMQTYLAAVRRWPDAKITLRNREKIIEQSWED
jgi:hypothetical protein